MKKSLMLISFAFIFLLTLSVVSVSAGLWITGDIQRTTSVESGGLATSVKSADSGTTFSRTSSTLRTGTSSSSQNNQEKGPRGWAPATTADGKRCWIPPAKSKGLFGRR